MIKINTQLTKQHRYRYADLYFIEITALFVAILGVIHVLFTLRVGIYRISNSINVGDGGDSELLRRIRGHDSFIETVPMGCVTATVK